MGLMTVALKYIKKLNKKNIEIKINKFNTKNKKDLNSIPGVCVIPIELSRTLLPITYCFLSGIMSETTPLGLTERHLPLHPPRMRN